MFPQYANLDVRIPGVSDDSPSFFLVSPSVIKLQRTPTLKYTLLFFIPF